MPQLSLYQRALLIALTPGLLTLPAAAFDSGKGSPHAGIVRDALSATFNQNNLNLIESSLAAQADSKEMPAAKLFTPENFKSSVNFVDRTQKKILDYAAEADTSNTSRYLCLKYFGQMLFVVQDFYSRSNYVENEAAVAMKKHSSGQFNPYNLDLVDWHLMHTTLASRPLKDSQYGPTTQPKENESQGSAIIGNATYYKVAREMAVRDTLHQWELLEILIKRRFPGRSITILAALKEASAPLKEPDVLD